MTRYTFLSLLSVLVLTTAGSATARASAAPIKTRTALQVPVINGKPVVDGKLDDPCWKKAARIGPLKEASGKATKATTEAWICRDADNLYVSVSCTLNDTMKSKTTPHKRRWRRRVYEEEHVALLIDSNSDRNSYYQILITPKGIRRSSYREHQPPWRDHSWKPKYESAAVVDEKVWTAEFSLPFSSFYKNKTLTDEFGFNIRRYIELQDGPLGEIQCWRGEYMNPADAGTLTGIPARKHMPAPEYARVTVFGHPPPTEKQKLFFDHEKGQTIRLGPGSSHPSTTGEVRLELEGFLLGGDPHARGIIWDLAVDEKKGELYVLSVPRMRMAPQIQVFDRRGKYLRTVMPFNPSLPRAGLKDLCWKTALEGGAELVVPKLYETPCWADLAIYGEWWHLPQKMILAPNGDLIMSNIWKGTLWRMRPDGSLPPEGWTSIYHAGRNEPFESTSWIMGGWQCKNLDGYLPYSPLHYPYMCFDRDGNFYVTGGGSTKLSSMFAWIYEMGGGGSGSALWKFRLHDGIKLTPLDDFRFNGDRKLAKARNHLGEEKKKGLDDSHFYKPCGIVVDDQGHLIVADHARIKVFKPNGRLVASIRKYKQGNKKVLLTRPTALAMDKQGCLYVLLQFQTGAKGARKMATKIIKLKSWRNPRLLATSKPLHRDVIQIAVDGGVKPSLVWVANATGWGTLMQLSGDDLSQKRQWVDSGEKLSCPAQYGHLPILNTDPQTGHIYVEDDSNYSKGKHGTVYRTDQDGAILKKWASLNFGPKSKHDGLTAGTKVQAVVDLHYRYPKETLFLDSLFGKDGKIYRWKRSETEIAVLRFDRTGKPIPFKATGTHALIVDRSGLRRGKKKPFARIQTVGFYRGMDVDKDGNIT